MADGTTSAIAERHELELRRIGVWACSCGERYGHSAASAARWHREHVGLAGLEEIAGHDGR